MLKRIQIQNWKGICMSEQESLLGLFRSDVMALDSRTQKNLFNSYRSLVYHDIFILMNDTALTEDVIQEGFMKAIKHGQKTYPHSNMRAWIKQITRRIAIDMLRKNHKYLLISDSETIMKSIQTSFGNDNPVILYENALEKETLFEALSELSVEQRIILTLRYGEELSYEEIAKELQISEPATGKRLQRARQILTKLFVQKWGE